MFKWVLDRGPEQRESKLTVLFLLIIIIFISYIIIYYIIIKFQIIIYGVPSQPKPETELLSLWLCFGWWSYEGTPDPDPIITLYQTIRFHLILKEKLSQ